MLFNRFFFTIFYMCFTISSSGWCYEVQPMIQDITPFGQKSQTTLMIKNTRNRPLSVNIEAISINITKDGKIIEEDGSDLFTLPFTAIIPAGKSQSVAVRYLGEPDIKKSKSFFVEISEVPIQLKSNETSQVKTALTFKTLVNVVPLNASANIEIDAIKENEKTLDIILLNKGNKYTLINDTIWNFSPKNGASNKNNIKLNGRSLTSNLVGSALLEPGKYIKYKLTDPKKIDLNKYQLTKIISR